MSAPLDCVTCQDWIHRDRTAPADPDLEARAEQHLDGCDDCAGEAASLDELGGLLDALPGWDASDDAVAAVLDRVAADRQVTPPQPTARTRAPRRPFGLPSGLAAAAMLVATVSAVVVLTRYEPEPEAMTVKGDAPSAHVEIGLSLLRGGSPVALPPGALARPEDTVLFRYTTDHDGFVYLFRLDGADVEVFHGAAALAGTHHFAVGGEVQGYGLAGLTGEQAFGVAWSLEPWPAGDDGPLARDDLGAALGGGAGPPFDLRRIVVEGPP